MIHYSIHSKSHMTSTIVCEAIMYPVHIFRHLILISCFQYNIKNVMKVLLVLYSQCFLKRHEVKIMVDLDLFTFLSIFPKNNYNSKSSSTLLQQFCKEYNHYKYNYKCLCFIRWKLSDTNTSTSVNIQVFYLHILHNAENIKLCLGEFLI